MPVIMQNPVKENRLGSFSIDIRFFEKEPNLIMRIMGKCIIVEAHSHYYNRSVEYVAYCSEFQPHDAQIMLVPIYNITVTEDNEGKKLFKFVKSENPQENKILRTITFGG